ncbi:MAG: tRNA (guanine-N(7)-)-methyltransferase [Myxococcota bacterium]|jgi:tRNA (guanine-N(7)-)-methyltransferase
MTARDIPGALNGSRLLLQPRYAAEVARWQAALDREGPVLLEVGFDHGRRLLNTARLNPDWQVLGIEVRRRRVEQAAERAAERSLVNVLPWRADARTVLATVTPPACLDVVEVLFPTPWPDTGPKSRRRLLTAEFLGDVARALRPGGVLLMATDVEEEAERIAAALAQVPGLVDAPEARQARPACTAHSRREWKCEAEGLAVHRFNRRRSG